MTDEAERDSLGGRIERAYKRMGWTQRDAAERIGTPQSTLSLWVTDDRTPGAENLRAVVDALGVDGHWLLTGEGLPERPPSANDAAARLALIRELTDPYSVLSADDLRSIRAAMSHPTTNGQAAGG